VIKKRIAIFISGKGSNAEQICAHFSTHSAIEIGLILSSKEDSPGFQGLIADGYTGVVLSKSDSNNGNFLTNLCSCHRIDFVILAGYLRLIPSDFVRTYENRMINVHPSLLPKYGGKGMYGQLVHEAVKQAGEKRTGISIHYVDVEFDTGRLIAQFFCDLRPEDSTEQIALKVRGLEHFYFPRVIEFTVLTALL
jgi:phosphoribosylglycinamide formyltransferase-1